MRILNLLIVTTLAVFLVNCGGETPTASDLFSVVIKNKKKTYTTSETVSVSTTNKKNKPIDSIVYFLDSERLNSTSEASEVNIALNDQKLGQRSLLAVIYTEGTSFEVATNLTLLASTSPTLYTYRILETYPHDMNAYTQGLEFHDNTLYESTGQRGQSSLRKTAYTTGEVLEKVALADQYFGEGLTILNNKIYQLTWQARTGLIYDLATLERTGSFAYGQSKEGWGLCNDGTSLYKSDGTQRIWRLNANTLAEEDYIEIYTNKSKINSVNELEWIDGKIYANIYQKGAIAIVNPTNGAVEGVIDLNPLKNEVTQHQGLDVLNGIAYNGEPNIIYVTGKNWDKLFKIEIVEK